MHLHSELINTTIDFFVQNFNDHKYEEACSIYTDRAILIDDQCIVVGRHSIVMFYEHSDYSNITNHHIVDMYLTDDLQHAMVLVEFTLASNTGESVVFRHCCTNLLFELSPTGNPVIVSGTSLVLR
jgi:hypothetical protein